MATMTSAREPAEQSGYITREDIGNLILEEFVQLEPAYETMALGLKPRWRWSCQCSLPSKPSAAIEQRSH